MTVIYWIIKVRESTPNMRSLTGLPSAPSSPTTLLLPVRNAVIPYHKLTTKIGLIESSGLPWHHRVLDRSGCDLRLDARQHPAKLCVFPPCPPESNPKPSPTAASNYIAQQNSPLPGSGARAHVPTTSIYTYTDDIVQPQLIDSTSNLPGAGNHAIQDLDVCGPSAVADHFMLIVSPQAFGLAFAALEHGSPVDLTKSDKT